jgi:hypothetical protein
MNKPMVIALSFLAAVLFVLGCVRLGTKAGEWASGPIVLTPVGDES